MANYHEIKRKNARFPAFSDEEGVKIQSDKSMTFFSNEEQWILTESNSESTFFSQPVVAGTDRTLRRSQRVGQEKMGHSIEQREELKRHRQNLPDYSKQIKTQATNTGKKKLFSDATRQASFQVKEKRAEQIAQKSIKKEYSGRSYFVPKYIPASLIEEEEKKDVQQQEVVEALQKPKNSYLLFDDEPAAYQEKKEDQPSVKKFNQPTSVEMTRSQYRETSKKKAVKKNSVLERSLEGLIAEETKSLDSNSYFTKN